MFTKTSNKILLGLLLFLFSSVLALAITFRSNIQPRQEITSENRESIQGNRNVISQQIPLNTFDTLLIQGEMPLQIELVAGEGEATLTADENLTDVVSMTVNNQKLTVTFNTDQQVSASRDMKLTIPVQQFSVLVADGQNRIVGKDLQLEKLQVLANQESQITLGVQTQQLMINVQDKSEFRLHGTANDATIQTGGQGNLYAEDFEAQTTTLNIQGSGTVDYNISGKVTLDVTSQGKLLFHGAQ